MGAEVAPVVLLRDGPGGEGGVICVGVEEASSGLAAGLHGLQTKSLFRVLLFFYEIGYLSHRTRYVVRVALVEAEGSRWGGASGRRAGGTGGTYGGQAVERGVYRFISRMPERRVLQHGVERTLLVGPARRTNPRLPPPSPSPVSPPHALQTAFQPQWHVFSYSPSFFP